MIRCILTVDYEIGGNGRGTLRDYVLDPARLLKSLVDRHGAKLVLFVEALELERIGQAGADEALEEVREQVRALHREGHEIALHLHPQWYNARRENGGWVLDDGEYNLCSLPRERIRTIVEAGLRALRDVLGDPGFVPLSFRSGNWLMQPSGPVAEILAGQGLRVDSSVFKGGRQRKWGMDYLPALRNGWYWKFSADVNKPDPSGVLLEIPIHSRMVPPWRLLTPKRLGWRHPGPAAAGTMASRLGRLNDFVRLRQPVKFDYCAMTAGELANMLARVVREDRADPGGFRPLVAIGHTKDLRDGETIAKFLTCLQEQGIGIWTLAEAYRHIAGRSEAAG